MKRIGKITGIVAGLVSAFLAVGGAVWTASADRATIRARGEANQADVADHEARLRTLEKELGRIGADVHWIRQTMERGGKP